MAIQQEKQESLTAFRKRPQSQGVLSKQKPKETYNKKFRLSEQNLFFPKHQKPPTNVECISSTYELANDTKVKLARIQDQLSMAKDELDKLNGTYGERFR